MSRAVRAEGPRRRPPAGGYARGEEVRARIVVAALARFAADGYERASTRRIAEDAGVNPPALQYYFAGKEGLHQACAEALAAEVLSTLAPVLAIMDAVGADDPDAAVDGVVALATALMDMLLPKDASAPNARFMARGLGEEGTLPAYSWMRETTGVALNGRARRMVAIATGVSADDALTRVRTMALMAPVKAFHVGRIEVQRRLGWPDLAGERLEMVKQVTAEQIRATLAALRPAREV